MKLSSIVSNHVVNMGVCWLYANHVSWLCVCVCVHECLCGLPWIPLGQFLTPWDCRCLLFGNNAYNFGVPNLYPTPMEWPNVSFLPAAPVITRNVTPSDRIQKPLSSIFHHDSDGPNHGFWDFANPKLQSTPTAAIVEETLVRTMHYKINAEVFRYAHVM